MQTAAASVQRDAEGDRVDVHRVVPGRRIGVAADTDAAAGHEDRSVGTVSHLPFAISNRTINPIVTALLRSRGRGLLGRRIALLTVTGRRSGREHTFPVHFARTGDHLTIAVGAAGRKRWWRNLREEETVGLLLDGVSRRGRARAVGNEKTGITVEVDLDPR